MSLEDVARSSGSSDVADFLRIAHNDDGSLKPSALGGSITYVAAPTGVAATDNAAVAAANAIGGRVSFPAGTYALTSGITLDPRFAQWELDRRTTLDFSGLASGYALTIAATVTPRFGLLALSGGQIVGPTSGANGIQMGGVGLWGKGLRVADVEIKNFLTQVSFQDNTWKTHFENVNFNGAQVAAVDLTNGSNMGEDMLFTSCVIFNGPQEGVLHSSFGSDSLWVGCSFDYQGRAINMTNGTMVCVGCHFEGDDVRVATGASEYILVTDQTTQPKLRLNSCRFASAFTTRPRWITSPTTKREAVTITDPSIHA